jgi:hypothetical protein
MMVERVVVGRSGCCSWGQLGDLPEMKHKAEWARATIVNKCGRLAGRWGGSEKCCGENPIPPQIRDESSRGRALLSTCRERSSVEANTECRVIW